MELTQAEKEMIAIKREQEALLKKERELQKQVSNAKCIADKKEYMVIVMLGSYTVPNAYRKKC